MLTGFFVLVYLIYRKIKDSASVKWWHWPCVVTFPLAVDALASVDAWLLDWALVLLVLTAVAQKLGV